MTLLYHVSYLFVCDSTELGSHFERQGDNRHITRFS